jgi:hypothetical protein
MTPPQVTALCLGDEPLNFLQGHFVARPVVEFRRPWTLVILDLLRLFERLAVLKIRRDS